MELFLMEHFVFTWTLHDPPSKTRWLFIPRIMVITMFDSNGKCCHYLIPDTHKIPSSREQNVTRKIPSPTLLRAEFTKSYSLPVQLYGSSGIWPLGHLHRYEPTVFSQIVCPLQWWPYFPPFVRHSLTSKMKNQIKWLKKRDIVISNQKCLYKD